MDWADIGEKLEYFINGGAPLIEALEPSWTPAIQLGSKLLTAAANAEPTAVALVKTIQHGEPPTPAELQSFSASYEAAYQALHTDVAAQIANTPAG